MRTYSGIAETLSTVVTRSEQLDRKDTIEILRQILINHKDLLAAYIVAEPDAFDGKDREFIASPGSDQTGRFCPYWNRMHGLEELSHLQDIETSDWYRIPKSASSPQVMEPYLYQGVWMTSFISPFTKNGAFAGIVGVDMALQRLDDVVGRIKVLQSGYAFLTSGKGLLYSFPQKEFIGEKTLKQYAQETNTIPLLAFFNRKLARFTHSARSGWTYSLRIPLDKTTTELRA